MCFNFDDSNNKHQSKSNYVGRLNNLKLETENCRYICKDLTLNNQVGRIFFLKINKRGVPNKANHEGRKKSQKRIKNVCNTLIRNFRVIQTKLKS